MRNRQLLEQILKTAQVMDKNIEKLTLIMCSYVDSAEIECENG